MLPDDAAVGRYISWAVENFPVTSKTNAIKLVEEAEELLESPNDAEEMADVLMVVCYQAHLAGVDLASAFENKLAKNRVRAWRRNKDGTYSGTSFGSGHGDHVLSSEQAEIWQAHSAFIDAMSRHGIKWGDMVMVERARITAILDEMLAETVGPGTVLTSAAMVGARQALTEAKRRIEGNKESGDG